MLQLHDSNPGQLLPYFSQTVSSAWIDEKTLKRFLTYCFNVLATLKSDVSAQQAFSLQVNPEAGIVRLPLALHKIHT